MSRFAEFASQFLVTKEKPTPRPKSWEEIVDNTIDEQIRIANGEFVKGSKKKEDGTYPSKSSWLKDGCAKPRIGIMPVFETNQSFDNLSNENYKVLLDIFKDWRNQPELKGALDSLKSRKEENDRKRREKSA